MTHRETGTRVLFPPKPRRKCRKTKNKTHVVERWGSTRKVERKRRSFTSSRTRPR